MDCHQARHRLTGDLSLDSVSRTDDDLEQHLASCPACRQLFEAAAHLRRAFDQTRTEFDDSAMPPFSEVRRTMEAAARTKTWRGFYRMRDFWRYGSGGARWGVGMGAFAVVLALLTLVPFKYEKTVGYEVALAGVDPALAHNEARLRSILASLGAENATVELLRCDSVCEVKISDLSEMKQCQMLVCAMKELGPVEVLEEGTAIFEPASGPILELARIRVFSDQTKSISDDEVRRMVASFLGENVAGSASVEMCSAESLIVNCTIPCPPDSGRTCIVVMRSDSQSCGAAGGMACALAIGAEGWPAGCGSTCAQMKFGAPKGTSEHALLDSDPAFKEGALVPGRFMLAQNHPNPFNPSTDIEFSLPASAPVRLEVFNTLGRKVRTLVNRTLPSGVHTITWDARSDEGERVPSGAYLYRLSAGELVESKTMTLLK